MLVTMLQTIVKVPVFLSSLVDPLFPVDAIINVVLLYLPVLWWMLVEGMQIGALKYVCWVIFGTNKFPRFICSRADIVELKNKNRIILKILIITG